LLGVEEELLSGTLSMIFHNSELAFDEVNHELTVQVIDSGFLEFL